MKTFIVGASSNLSVQMKKGIRASELISARDLLASSINPFPENGERFNVIINSFWPATRLGDLSRPEEYLNLAIVTTAKILEFLKSKNINRLYYTSSASVYGENKNCTESDNPYPRSLHAGLKFSNEKLVSGFCDQHDIPYTIARLFNLYGGDDNFSIITKIINACKTGQELTVVNEGNSVRDFIFIEDVVRVFKTLLESDVTENIINIASGRGRSILSILVHLRKNGFEIQTKSIERDEISLSIADVSKLEKYYDSESMMDPRDYTLKVLQNKL